MAIKTTHEVTVNSTDIADLLEDLNYLAYQGTAIRNQIKIITCKLSKLNPSTKGLELLLSETNPNNSANFTSNQEGGLNDSLTKIIPFPGLNTQSPESENQRHAALTPIMALPGISLPEDIPDYRPILQRDGLILLAWDKRITETGERYTAYWVTSIGVPRFYASKPFSPTEFSSAHPDHKSYAAEDGIEFYGQEAPEYTVHVAPELMMSNPRHGELRPTHINKLKYQGSNVNFNYKYLLKTEKNRNLPSRRHNKGGNRAS